MITIHHTAEVPYPIEKMYALVNDISTYPQFIPFCTAAKSTTLNKKEVKGTLTFAGLGIVESFVTHNVLCPPDEVKMTLIDGPSFKYLKGGWKFNTLPSNGTRVEFSLAFAFDFSNAWVDYVLQPIFNTLSYSAMQVFIDRAHDCYGDENIPLESVKVT